MGGGDPRSLQRTPAASSSLVQLFCVPPTTSPHNQVHVTHKVPCPHAPSLPRTTSPPGSVRHQHHHCIVVFPIILKCHVHLHHLAITFKYHNPLPCNVSSSHPEVSHSLTFRCIIIFIRLNKLTSVGLQAGSRAWRCCASRRTEWPPPARRLGTRGSWTSHANSLPSPSAGGSIFTPCTAGPPSSAL